MNITDLIVDFIKEGNVVEFPGMGTLSSSNVDAYHDAASGTYYPARRSVAMTADQSGNRSIISRIAEKECVTPDIAEQMWNNYVGALSDKLQRNASGHEFTGIGVMRRMGGRVVFDAVEGLDLDADKRVEQPLENVATYTPKNAVDPFAAFEKPVEAPAPVEAPKPAETIVEAPKPVETPKPIETPKPVEAPKPVEPIVEEKPIEAPKPVEPIVEVKPEESSKSEKTEKNSPVIETIAAAAAATAATAATASNAEHLSEVKRMLDEIPSSPKDAKAQRRAEKAAAKAEKAARKAAEEAEKAAAKKAAKMAKDKDAQAKAAAKAAPMVKAENNEAEGEEKKKKKHGWLWIVILLLLVLAGGGAYYYFVKGNSILPGTSCAQEVKVSYCDDFMANFYLLKYEENHIANSAVHVHNYMAEYVHNFLLARHYGNAFAPVMSMVDEYASDRLHELMVEGYCVKRFFPYEYFWMNRNYADYRNFGARVHEYTVQGELMDIDLLESMLDDVVTRLGLHADGFGLGRAAAVAAPAAKVNDKPYVETVPEAPTFRNSKQGYDIIAGFFTSKTSANKCANQLKALGSDAYVISKSGGYYVSMGSAPTMTAAQAMEKHIKSWYKSDVTIKNFNE